jgi:hypothetical protein
MIPELAVTTLVCARIGAIHLLFFEDSLAWWQLVLMTALVKWSSPQIIAAIKQLI